MTPLSRRALLSRVAAAAMLSSFGTRARADSDSQIDQPLRELYAGLETAMRAGRTKPFIDRFDALAPVIERVFDLKNVLMVSIGPRWSTFDEKTRTNLETVFHRFIVATYVASFDKYEGEKFHIVPELRDLGADRIVHTEIIAASGENTRLDYVMRRAGGSWRAEDVLIQGSISRVGVLRSDFRKILANGNGEALVASLRRKIADLSGGALDA